MRWWEQMGRSKPSNLEVSKVLIGAKHWQHVWGKGEQTRWREEMGRGKPSDLEVSKDLIGAKHWQTCLGKGEQTRWQAEMGRGKPLQILLPRWSGVTIGHQPMSTCPMATLGPPRDPTDTNT